MPRRPSFSRPVDKQEQQAFADIAACSFGTLPEKTRPLHEKMGPELTRVLRLRGQIAGGLVLHRMGQWFGGKLVSMTGVGEVAVAPDHRAHLSLIHI